MSKNKNKKPKKRYSYFSRFAEIEPLLKSFNKPFRVSVSNNTVTYTMDNDVYVCSSSKLKKSDLGFLSKVKSDVSGNVSEVQYIFDEDDVILYNGWGSLPDGTYTDLIEVDINSAYWRCAYLNGYISKDIYEEGNEKDKKVRLASLGALATNKSIYTYNPKTGRFDYEFEESINSKNPVLSSVFFKCAYDVGNMLNECMELLKTKYLLYWVDAVIVKDYTKDFVIDFFNKNGYECKVKDLKEVTVETNEHGVRNVCCKEVVKTLQNGEENVKEKVFSMNSRKAEKSIEFYRRIFVKSVKK